MLTETNQYGIINKLTARKAKPEEKLRKESKTRIKTRKTLKKVKKTLDNDLEIW